MEVIQETECKFCDLTLNSVGKTYNDRSNTTTWKIDEAPNGELALFAREVGDEDNPSIIPVEYCPLCGRRL